MESRRLTARGRERREELLAFATRRFAEKGFHPTSVSEIVNGVGVGKGVFYWYFPSKDLLLREILQEGMHSLRRAQKNALRDASDPVERIELGIRATMQWWVENPDVVRLISFSRTEETFAPVVQQGRRTGLADTARHLSDAIDAGLIAPGDPALLAAAIHGMIEELARGSINASCQLDPTVVDTAVRMCLRGIIGTGIEPGAGTESAGQLG
jgi:AcrR family transcriptional regulator